jgi:DNA-binding response OmpR family regulator
MKPVLEDRQMDGNRRTVFISDNLDTTRLFAYALQRKNITTAVVGSAAEAIDHRRGWGRNLLVINNCAGEIDIFAVCQQARKSYECPCLLLDYRTDEPYMAEAYKAGVDDYIAKPIGLHLFQLKVVAWLRHVSPQQSQLRGKLARNGFSLDPIQSQLKMKCGSVVDLTNLEFRLLHFLLRRPGEIFESRRIIEHVWGANCDDGRNHALLKNLVYRLRRKVEPDPHQPTYLQTVFGRGYKLQLQEEQL